MTTYAEFLTRLGNMEIEGVTRRYGYGQTPPAALNAGELPASWVQLPEGDHASFSLGIGATWPEFRAQLIVAVLAIAGNTQADSFQKTVEMMDAVRVVLDNTRLAKSATRYTMKQTAVQVASTAYWAVEVDVIASG